jgi:hypothetical protein
MPAIHVVVVVEGGKIGLRSRQGPARKVEDAPAEVVDMKVWKPGFPRPKGAKQ